MRPVPIHHDGVQSHRRSISSLPTGPPSPAGTFFFIIRARALPLACMALLFFPPFTCKVPYTHEKEKHVGGVLPW